MKRRAVIVSLAVVAAGCRSLTGSQAQPVRTKPLQIYVVDTEGGKATLFVSPPGRSLLIDTGNPGGRDTDRIMEVIADAGVKKIDYLITHALSRRSHRRHAGAGEADSDRDTSSITDRASKSASRSRDFSRRTPSCTARRSTPSSKPGDQRADHRARLAHRDVGGARC